MFFIIWFRFFATWNESIANEVLLSTVELLRTSRKKIVPFTRILIIVYALQILVVYFSNESYRLRYIILYLVIYIVLLSIYIFCKKYFYKSVFIFQPILLLAFTSFTVTQVYGTADVMLIWIIYEIVYFSIIMGHLYNSHNYNKRSKDVIMEVMNSQVSLIRFLYRYKVALSITQLICILGVYLMFNIIVVLIVVFLSATTVLINDRYLIFIKAQDCLEKKLLRW